MAADDSKGELDRLRAQHERLVRQHQDVLAHRASDARLNDHIRQLREQGHALAACVEPLRQ